MLTPEAHSDCLHRKEPRPDLTEPGICPSALHTWARTGQKISWPSICLTLSPDCVPFHFQGLDGAKGEKGESGERGPSGLPVSVVSLVCR